MSGEALVTGTCDARFEPVRAAFEASFTADVPTPDQELGAALCIVLDGVIVLDLWGGFADSARRKPWASDTAGLCFSATKAFTALVIHKLAEGGLIDLEAHVADYWPAFAAHGKGAITIDHVLTHRAGVPMVNAGTRDLGFDVASWEAALVQAEPLHAPGARQIYHAFTYGYLLNAVARYATGEQIPELFGRLFAKPMRLSATIGVPDGDVRDLFTVEAIAPAPDAPAPSGLKLEIMSQAALPIDWNARAFLSAVVPAGNGIATARDLARLYAGLIGPGAAIERSTLDRMCALAWDGVEESSGQAWRMGHGVMLANAFTCFGPGARAFGHPGVGGATGFADPDLGLAVGYVPNRLDPRGPGGRFSRVMAEILHVLS